MSLTPAQRDSLLAAVDALGGQLVALRAQVLACGVTEPPRPAETPDVAPCGHAGAKRIATMGDGEQWVCGDCA